MKVDISGFKLLKMVEQIFDITLVANQKASAELIAVMPADNATADVKTSSMNISNGYPLPWANSVVPSYTL